METGGCGNIGQAVVNRGVEETILGSVAVTILQLQMVALSVKAMKPTQKPSMKMVFSNKKIFNPAMNMNAQVRKLQ